MQPKFIVSVSRFDEFHELPGSWTDADFHELLEQIDYGDASDLDSVELREMCILALQDLEPDDAAAIMLRCRLGDVLSAGQIQNAAQEMLEDKLWEEYADFSLHERFFHVGSLLFAAFPNVCPEPEAVSVELAIEPQNEYARELLQSDLNESFFVRVIADAGERTMTLCRLFEDQLNGAHFPEAEHIAWIVHTTEKTPERSVVQLIGSRAWMGHLSDVRAFPSTAVPDRTRD